mgnify:FL=1
MHTKITIIGLGLVGRSLLNMLIGEGAFLPDDISVMDMSRDACEYFKSIGGKSENFLQRNLDSRNYQEIFKAVKKGDYLIRLADGLDDMVLVEECINRGIHYICTSDDMFIDIPSNESFSYRTHFYQYKELKER